MKRHILIILFSFLTVAPGFAWGPKGHRIVAQVAYNHLTRKAQRSVDAVLGKHGIIYWSTWPDEIKSDEKVYPTSYDWHFQDLDANMTDSAVIAVLTDYPTHGGNLYRMTDSLINALKKNPYDADALVFIVHLTGDRFCPMHMGHEHDRGGNSVRCKWFENSTNLHSIWDVSLIEYKGYSYSEYARYLEDKLSGQREKIIAMTPEELIVHNYHLTDAIYKYQKKWDNNAYHYAYYWSQHMEWQLYAAGIRLAQLLNEIYR